MPCTCRRSGQPDVPGQEEDNEDDQGQRFSTNWQGRLGKPGIYIPSGSTSGGRRYPLIATKVGGPRGGYQVGDPSQGQLGH